MIDAKVDTDTDFMPHPDHTKDFQEISEAINSRGGTAYLREEAVRVEEIFRNTPKENVPLLKIESTAEYVAEMQDLVYKKMDRAKIKIQDFNRLQAEQKSIEKEIENIDGSESARLSELKKRARIIRIQIEDHEAELQLTYSHIAKYLIRIDQVNNALSKRYEVDTPDYALETWKDVRQAIEDQGRRTSTSDHSEYMALFSDTLLKRHIENYAEILSAIVAKHPSETDKIRNALDILAHSNPHLEKSILARHREALEEQAGKKSANRESSKNGERSGATEAASPLEAPSTESLQSICDQVRKRGLSEEEAMQEMQKYKTLETLWPENLSLPSPKDALLQAREEALNWFEKNSYGLADAFKPKSDSGHRNIMYGYWFSPGWWGGSTLKDRVGPMPPVDSLDAVTMRHDFAYQIADQFEEGFRDPALGERMRAMADIVAVMEALALPSDPAQWAHPPQDPAQALRMRAMLIYGFTVLAPIRNKFLARTWEALQAGEDLVTLISTGPLSVATMEIILTEHELAKLSEYKNIDFDNLRKIVDNRVFQWFLRYGKEDERVYPDQPGTLARILDTPGAFIQRTHPESTIEPGTVIAEHSGQWVKAYGGWRTEENPPNRPAQIGPISLEPGRYRAHLSFVPDIFPSMTASNSNTGLSVTHHFRGGSKRVASFAKFAEDKPSGEASQEFVIDRPGEIVLGFSPAVSSGHAGGYAEHEQRYTGSIIYLEPLKEEVAEVCSALKEGDVLRGATCRARR